MDNLTHGLVGALIGQTGLKRKTGLAMPALIIGANLPDVDATCFLWLHGTEHLAFRRGITHGPPALLLLPLALAGILWGYDRWQARRGKRPQTRLPVRLGWLYLLALIGCLSHPALDWLNVYGIRLLEPFSHRWFYGDALFIIDLWLWLLLGVSTWLSLRRERGGGNWHKPARIGLASAVAYIVANLLYSQGIARAAMHDLDGAVPQPVKIIANPPMLTPWRREILAMDGSQRWYVTDYSPFSGLGETVQLEPDQCAVNASALPRGNRQVDAFLFWARAPITIRRGGGVTLQDARYLTTGEDSRFKVDLPQVSCLEPPAG